MGTNSNETITLHLGPLSSRVGVHFWHLQAPEMTVCPDGTGGLIPISDASYDANALFEEVNSGFRPRALFIDFGKSLNVSSAVQSPLSVPRSILWDGKVDTVVRSTCEPAWYECLSMAERNLWMTNGAFCNIPENFGGCALSASKGDQEFLGCFTQGLDLLSSSKPFADEVEDRFRQIIERCSCPRQIQLVVDAEDGFVGAVSRLIDYVTEELPKRPIFTLPLYDTFTMRQSDAVRQLFAKANELFLVVLMEPDADNYFKGSWMPMDFSGSVSISNPCYNSAVLAASWSTFTSFFWSLDQFHRCSLEDFIWKIQLSHGLRVLTSRIGIAVDNRAPARWQCLSPYAAVGRASDSSLWRQLFLRGFQSGPDNQCLIEHLSGQSANSSSNQTGDSLPIGFPSLQPGVQLQVSSLSDLPLTVSSDKTYPNTRCHQPRSLRAANVTDIPGNESAEARSFERLVQSMKKTIHTLPTLAGIEQDMWLEYVEAAQTRLVDVYCKPSAH